MEGGQESKFICHFLDEQEMNNGWELSGRFLGELQDFVLDKLREAHLCWRDTPERGMAVHKFILCLWITIIIFKGGKKFVLDSSL